MIVVVILRQIAVAVAVAVAVLVVAANCGRGDLEATGPAQGGTSSSTTTAALTTAAGATSTPGPTAGSTSTDLEATTTTSRQRGFTMAFTGDLLLHSRVNAMAAANAGGQPGRDYDYRPMLQPIRPLVEAADWAVCHMEVNLSADGTRLEPYPTFRAPGQIAVDIADIGYDSCSVASNHILDHGIEGVAETLQVLDRAGLGATGAARSRAEASRQIWIELGGLRVAHLAYTYWFNGFTVPADASWTSNGIDEDRILADASAARADGADFVVVSLHWGDQYDHRPNRQQRELGPRVLASPDVDLLVGHHAHVVQPIDNLDGEWLIYGLGNLLSNSPQPARRDELLVLVTVSEGPTGELTSELEVIPLHLDHSTLTVHPSNPLTRPPSTAPDLAADLDASWARVNRILDTGTGRDALVIG